MKVLRLSLVFFFLFSLFSLTSCLDVEKVAEDMVPVIHGADVLRKFHQESNRLPNDNNELLAFCKEKSISLDLSKFSKFNYHLSSDSTITLDYEL